jgi:hypothetical protein
LKVEERERRRCCSLFAFFGSAVVSSLKEKKTWTRLRALLHPLHERGLSPFAAAGSALVTHLSWRAEAMAGRAGRVRSGGGKDGKEKKRRICRGRLHPRPQKKKKRLKPNQKKLGSSSSSRPSNPADISHLRPRSSRADGRLERRDVFFFGGHVRCGGGGLDDGDVEVLMFYWFWCFCACCVARMSGECGGGAAEEREKRKKRKRLERRRRVCLDGLR